MSLDEPLDAKDRVPLARQIKLEQIEVHACLALNPFCQLENRGRIDETRLYQRCLLRELGIWEQAQFEDHRDQPRAQRSFGC